MIKLFKVLPGARSPRGRLGVGEGEREAGYGRHRRAAPPRRTSSCARAQSMGLRQKDYLESAHAAVRRRRRRGRRIEEEEGGGREMTEVLSTVPITLSDRVISRGN